MLQSYSIVKMDLLGVVVLFILFGSTNGESCYISDDESNWIDATKKCNLVVPDLTFSPEIITTEYAEENVWVGYYQARTALEYIGCAEKPERVPSAYTKADPGQCVSACGTQGIIGIFDNECFCFDDCEVKDMYTIHPFCNKKCDDIRGVLCGGSDNNGATYISIYRTKGPENIDEHSSEGDDDIKNCMYYSQKHFQWNSCDVRYRFICEKDGNVWIQTDNNDISFCSWSGATIICFANKSRPSTFENTRHLPTQDSTPQLWTGIIRSHVIYKYTIDSGYLKYANKFGYLKRNGDSYELKMEGHGKGNKKRLCVNDVNNASSSLPVSGASNTGNVKKVTTCDKLNISQENKGTSIVAAAVGATVSVVIVIIIVVALVLFLRKRGVHLSFLRRKPPTQGPRISRNNMAFAISGPIEIQHSSYNTSQDEYAQIDLKTTIDNEGADGAVNNAPETSDYAHDYFVLEKQECDPYDQTRSAVQESDPNTFNPYNKLRLEDYDHIGNGNTHGEVYGRNVPESGNIYNTTHGNSKLGTGTDASDTVYNMTDDNEDTYNHINVSTHKTGRTITGNDYDV